MLVAAFKAAGRNAKELEWIGGTRATFSSDTAVADLDEAMFSFADQIAAGYTTFCMKPSQHTDDVAEIPAICRRMVEHVASL